MAGAVTGHAFTAAGSFAVTLDSLERSEGLLSLIFKTKILYMYWVMVPCFYELCTLHRLEARGLASIVWVEPRSSVKLRGE
jgi:hypothetical protein